jgi:hypothetical protein
MALAEEQAIRVMMVVLGRSLVQTLEVGEVAELQPMEEMEALVLEEMVETVKLLQSLVPLVLTLVAVAVGASAERLVLEEQAEGELGPIPVLQGPQELSTPEAAVEAEAVLVTAQVQVAMAVQEF